MRILSLIIYPDLALKALRSCEGVSTHGRCERTRCERTSEGLSCLLCEYWPRA